MPLPLPLSDRVARGEHDLQYRDLPTLGLSDGQLRRWLREGFLTRVGPGSYLIDAPTGAADRHEDERIRYVRRCVAVVRGVPGSYVVGPSAAAVHDLPLFHMPGSVHLSRRPHARMTRQGAVTHHPWGTGPTSHTAAVPCQIPAETVIDVSASFGTERGLVVADAALHRELVTHDQLTTALRRFGTRRGVASARRVCELADGRVESPGESRVRWVLHSRGFELIPQVTIHDRNGEFVARVDFLLAGTTVVIEFDGMSKYTDPLTLRAEKVRQMRLERLGYVVVRLCWDDLRHPRRIQAMLDDAVRIAA